MPNCSAQEAVMVANRVREAVAQSTFQLPGGTLIAITVSIGCVSYPETTENFEALIQLADDGLYAAKRNGRNRVEVLAPLRTV